MPVQTGIHRQEKQKETNANRNHSTIFITFNLTASLQTAKERVICFRKISDIDLDLLSHTIGDLPVSASIDHYNDAFTSILDEFASLKNMFLLRDHLLGIHPSCRQLERKYKNSGLTVHRSMFDQYQIEYHNALKAAKVPYYSTIINSDISNPRVLFRTVNNLIKPPSNFNSSTIEQCNKFLNYFSSKIENIYNAYDAVTSRIL